MKSTGLLVEGSEKSCKHLVIGGAMIGCDHPLHNKSLCYRSLYPRLVFRKIMCVEVISQNQYFLSEVLTIQGRGGGGG